MKVPALNKSLISDDAAQKRFEASWKDAVSFPGPYTKNGRMVTALEQIRRLSNNISREKKRSVKVDYKRQFHKIQDAEAALQSDLGDLYAWDHLNNAQALLETQT